MHPIFDGSLEKLSSSAKGQLFYFNLKSVYDIGMVLMVLMKSHEAGLKWSR